MGSVFRSFKKRKTDDDDEEEEEEEEKEEEITIKKGKRRSKPPAISLLFPKTPIVRKIKNVSTLERASKK
ncbi:hypothetical protein BPOR_0037g00310 [Botrytis porri]|uniref:Uncharacterized protein n=1 Tax=Botrytis porri TaxID=87229 RepID=A0A4Z1L305_9HELO|nr:hypothetical protein BPOR_0037g00310 [Botrytis porri]